MKDEVRIVINVNCIDAKLWRLLRIYTVEPLIMDPLKGETPYKG